MSAISIGLIVVAIALAVFVGVRGYYWYCEGKKLQTSGYMTPASTKLARWTFKAVANVATRLLVGPVTVIGRENSFYKGRGLVLPNHVITHDFIVVGKTMPYGYRQLSKAAEIKNPVVATLAAWIGTVGVQVEGGKAQDGGGQAVVDTGAKIITASPGSRMLLFPQGMLTYTGDISPKTFRTGATRMLAKAASEINGEPLFVHPIAIDYKRNRSDATFFQKVVYLMGLQLLRTFRYKDKLVNPDGTPALDDEGKIQWTVKKSMVLYGATVVIGKPIPYADLPADPREAIEYIRQRIEAQLAVAQGKSSAAI